MFGLRTAVGLPAVLLLAMPAAAAVRVEYNATIAGVGVDPTGVTPAWSLSGSAMSNNGFFLLQDNTADNPTQQSGEYLSPSAGTGLMKNGSGNYGIEFRVRPLTDVAFIGSHWPELYVTWADNHATDGNYNVTIDLDADDGGPITTGSIVYGRNSFSPAITGIDWSVPHTIYIGYRGSANVFDFYLDGVLKSTITWGSIARSGNYAQDRVGFGDGTTGGNDVAAQWYFVRIHDTSVPPPASGTTVISYDAAGAVPPLADPTGVTPAWSRSSIDGLGMVNNGTFLLQDDTAVAGQQYREYLSPAIGGLMRNGVSDYGIEFRVRPRTDVAFIGFHWPELYVTWSDDHATDGNYNITIDLDPDDGGPATTGSIVYGRNSFSPGITGIDWSVPHTIFIGYRGASNVFDFYLDGLFQRTVAWGSIARATNDYARDAVGFGDGTNGGNDVAAEWYFVKVHSVSCPPVPITPGPLVEYDAGSAGGDPTTAMPPWTRFGFPMTDTGAYLLQDNTSDDPTTQSGEYLSPTVCNLMRLGAGQYGIAFRVRPLDDVPNLGLSHYANLYVTWSDDRFSYNVTIDQDTDDAGPGTSGGLRYGKDTMANAVTGIDWSVPHTIFVGYRGDALPAGEFDFYVDDVLAATVGAASIARPGGFARDSVDFGDGTTGQGVDVAAEWYFVRIYGSSTPPIVVDPCGDTWADTDTDLDVDLDDFGTFQACFTGEGGGILTGCECFDRPEVGSPNGDGDVDLTDFDQFKACATRGGVAAVVGCGGP